MFLPKAIIADNTSLTQAQINILLNRANQAYISGNYQEAIANWLKIVKKQEPQSNQLAIVYDNLASVHWHTGKSGAAIRYWRQAITIYRQTDNSLAKLAATLTDTARAYNDLGQPNFSIPLLTEAISYAEKEELTNVKRVAYLALGNAYTIQENYSAAIDAYQKSLKNIEQKNSDLPIVVWNNLSQAYQQQALKTEQKAIAAEQEGDLSVPRLWQQVKSDRASAWDTAKKATRIRENSKSIARVEALLQMAKLAKNDASKSSQAVDSLLKSEVILSALPDSYQKVYALIELGKLTNDYDSRSKKILESAVKIAQKINNPRASSFAMGAMGRHYEMQEQYDKALYWTKQAQFTAQQAQAPDSLYQWDWQAARVHHATGKTDTAIEAYERAIASLQAIGGNTTQS
ncbi:MAG: tetratricopeptide repeat protein, partial [Waterburya sp.]